MVNIQDPVVHLRFRFKNVLVLSQPELIPSPTITHLHNVLCHLYLPFEVSGKQHHLFWRYLWYMKYPHWAEECLLLGRLSLCWLVEETFLSLCFWGHEYSLWHFFFVSYLLMIICLSNPLKNYNGNNHFNDNFVKNIIKVYL